MILRDYQEACVNAVLARLRDDRATMVVVATGGGKSVMAGGILAARRRAGRGKALVIQHTDELIGQNSEAIPAVSGMRPSVVKAERDDWSGDVVFASVQTLARERRRADMPAFDTLVIDEAHRSAAPTYQAVIKDVFARNSDCKLVGLTATPARGDGKSLKDTYDSVAFHMPIGELVRRGILVPPRAFTVEMDGRDLLQRINPDDADADERSAKILDTRENNARVVEEWRAHADGLRSIFFCATIEHADNLAKAFRESGVRSELITGVSPDRQGIIRRFDQGHTTVLSNVMVLTEGFDCLDAETEILTPSGWRGRDGIEIGDDVMAFDRHTGEVMAVVARDVASRPVRAGERMVRWSSQHLDIRVTDGHRMLLAYGQKSSNDPLSFELAGELLENMSSYSMPLAARSWSQFEGIDLTEDEIRFAAWTFTDSYVDKRGALHLYQSKASILDEILALLGRLGLDHTDSLIVHVGGFKPGSSGWRIRVGRMPLRLRPFCRGGGDHELKVDAGLPEAWSRATREQFIIFYDELLKGDGSRKKASASGWLHYPSKQFVDAIMAMAIQRGLSSSVATTETNAGVPFYRVSVRKQHTIETRPTDPRATRITEEVPAEGEVVWCVTNSLGTLIARRNGKAVILGNCQPVSCIGILRLMGHIGSFVQAAGRGLRKVDPARYPGIVKTHCVILDFAGAAARHGTLDMPPELEDEELTEQRAGVSYKVCPDCESEVPTGTNPCPLCGFEWTRAHAEEDSAPQQFVLTEIELLRQSPFRWTEVEAGAMIASGFDAWAGLVQRGDLWVALGGHSKNKRKDPVVVGIGERAQALASADDFMRNTETGQAAHKSRSWLRQAASPRQMELMMETGAGQQWFKKTPTKYEAACVLTFQWNRAKITKVASRSA